MASNEPIPINIYSRTETDLKLENLAQRSDSRLENLEQRSDAKLEKLASEMKAGFELLRQDIRWFQTIFLWIMVPFIILMITLMLKH